MTSVDAVIVSFRSGPLLADSIRSIRAFVPQPRVVVVNNDQSDATAQVAAHSAGATVVANPTNRGFAAAVNQAVAGGAGEIVALLNPDVARIDGTFECVEAIFRRDPAVAAVGVRLLNPDGSIQESCRRAPTAFDFVAETLALARRFPSWRRARAFRMLDWDYDEEREVDAVSGALVFLRRAALDDVGLFDERYFVYSEELDWMIRAKARGWKTVFTPAVSAVHAGGGSSSETTGALSLLLLESWHRYARKHFGVVRSGLLRVAMAVLEALRWTASTAPDERRAAAARFALHARGRRSAARD